MVRKEQIVRMLEVGRDRWKLEKGYGMRWKVECTFSDLKRLLGDVLKAGGRQPRAGDPEHGRGAQHLQGPPQGGRVTAAVQGMLVTAAGVGIGEHSSIIRKY